MHTCPDCGQACYCNGDLEDHDTGEDEGCTHYLTGDCANDNEDFMDEYEP
jgi:hypothetical protein